MSEFEELSSREFEDRLSRELKRVPAPEGFAGRVMDRVAAQSGHTRLTIMPRHRGWMAVAAMLLVCLLLGGWQWKEREARREREQAALVQRQFDLAMQVTQRTLAGVQERIGHLGEIRTDATSTAATKREVEQ